MCAYSICNFNLFEMTMLTVFFTTHYCGPYTHQWWSILKRNLMLDWRWHKIGGWQAGRRHRTAVRVCCHKGLINLPQTTTHISINKLEQHDCIRSYIIQITHLDDENEVDKGEKRRGGQPTEMGHAQVSRGDVTDSYIPTRAQDVTKQSLPRPKW